MDGIGVREPYMDEIERKWSELSAPQLELFFKQSMESTASSIGSATPEYAAYANELGTLYRVTARYTEGETAFKEALASIEAQEGRSEHYATCLDNLAELYRLDGRLDECEHALAEADALFSDRSSDEYAACLNYQGHAKMARGAFEDAARLYSKALAILETSQVGTIDAATAFQNVAIAYQQAGQLDRATDYLQRALDVYDVYGLRVNAHYVGLLNTFGALVAQQGDVQGAADRLAQAVEALGQCKVSPLDAIVVWANAGISFARAGRVEDAKRAANSIRKLAYDHGLEGNASVQRALSAAEAWD